MAKRPAVIAAFKEAVGQGEDIDQFPGLEHVHYPARGEIGKARPLFPGNRPVEQALGTHIEVLPGAMQGETHRVRIKRFRQSKGVVFKACDLSVADQPYGFVVRLFNRSDIAIHNLFEAVIGAVEALQAMVRGGIENLVPVGYQPTHAPVAFGVLAGDVFVHPGERIPVIHIDGIEAAEPYAAEAVFGYTVDAAVVRSLRHGVETQVRCLGQDRQEEERYQKAGAAEHGNFSVIFK